MVNDMEIESTDEGDRNRCNPRISARLLSSFQMKWAGKPNGI
jgi:hypothetical protein